MTEHLSTSAFFSRLAWPIFPLLHLSSLCLCCSWFCFLLNFDSFGLFAPNLHLRARPLIFLLFDSLSFVFLDFVDLVLFDFLFNVDLIDYDGESRK